MENRKEKKKKERLKTDAEGAQAAVEWHRSSHCHGDGSLDGAVGSWSNSPQPSTMTSRCLRQSSCLPFPSRSRTARVALSGISSRNSGMVWCIGLRERWCGFGSPSVGGCDRVVMVGLAMGEWGCRRFFFFFF